ncbi:MAG: hypothetical protein AAB356_05540, partial [Deltaproteobacteria bacterium]
MDEIGPDMPLGNIIDMARKIPFDLENEALNEKLLGSIIYNRSAYKETYREAGRFLMEYFKAWPGAWTTEKVLEVYKQTIPKKSGNAFNEESADNLIKDLHILRRDYVDDWLRKLLIRGQIIKMELAGNKDARKQETLKSEQAGIQKMIDRIVKGEDVSSISGSDKPLTEVLKDVYDEGSKEFFPGLRVDVLDTLLDTAVERKDYSYALIIDAIERRFAFYTARITRALEDGEMDNRLGEYLELINQLREKYLEATNHFAGKQSKARGNVNELLGKAYEIVIAPDGVNAGQEPRDFNKALSKDGKGLDDLLQENKRYLGDSEFNNFVRIFDILKHRYQEGNLRAWNIGSDAIEPDAGLTRLLEEKVRARYEGLFNLKEREVLLNKLQEEIKVKEGKGVPLSLMNLAFLMVDVTWKTAEEKDDNYTEYLRHSEAKDRQALEGIKLAAYLEVLRSPSELAQFSEEEIKEAITYYQNKTFANSTEVVKEGISAYLAYIRYLEVNPQDSTIYIGNPVAMLVMNAMNLLQRFISAPDEVQVQAAKDQGFQPAIELLARMTSPEENGGYTIARGGEYPVNITVASQKYYITPDGGYIIRDVFATDGTRPVITYPQEKEALDLTHETIYQSTTPDSAIWITVSSSEVDPFGKKNAGEQNKEQQLRFNTSHLIPLADIGGRVKVDYTTLINADTWGLGKVEEHRVNVEVIKATEAGLNFRTGVQLALNKGKDNDRMALSLGMDTHASNTTVGVGFEQDGSMSFFAGHSQLFSIAGEPGRVALNYQDKQASFAYTQEFGGAWRSALRDYYVRIRPQRPAGR